MTTPKILIVDDEPFNVDYLEQELEELDCETITAVNGQEALDKVYHEMPDLVLLDIMMPIMDGFEVLSKLKADPDTRDIPIIVISASNELQSVVKGIRLGAEDYLPKPFEPTLLHARISSSLDKKRLRDIEQLYLQSLQRELDIGRDIQMSFLPSELPKVDGWEIAAYFKAAREVAGDFYDAFLLPDGNLTCVVGDVCDKGVSAALFMTLFRSLIRATSTTDIFSSRRDQESLTHVERLHHVITFTNHYIAKIHDTANMFATVFIGIFDLQNGSLAYINCGNEPALILREGEVVTELRPTGPVVGVIKDAQFSVKEMRINKDDMLLAFTDGLPDTKNEDDEFFRTEYLFAALSDQKGSPSTLLENLEAQMLQFSGETNQYDDVTLIAVKRVV
jgi:sigma-B regulation protein RsbU (phosphoserine phosphatase)